MDYRALKRNFFDKKYFKNLRTEHKMHRVNGFTLKLIRDFTGLLVKAKKEEQEEIRTILVQLHSLLEESEIIKNKCLSLDKLLHKYHNRKQAEHRDLVTAAHIEKLAKEAVGNFSPSALSEVIDECRSRRYLTDEAAVKALVLEVLEERRKNGSDGSYR